GEEPTMRQALRLSSRRRALPAAGCIALLVTLALPMRAAATAEEPGPTAAELKKLPLEMLLDVEVTSAAKRPQALAETPAAISIVTAEDIRRSGVRSLPEALRLAAGL